MHTYDEQKKPRALSITPVAEGHAKFEPNDEDATANPAARYEKVRSLSCLSHKCPAPIKLGVLPGRSMG